MPLTQLTDRKSVADRPADTGHRDESPSRRVGDTTPIAGDYQFRAITEGPAAQRFWHDTKLWLVREYLQPEPTDRALDVGCGSGVVAGYLADFPVREVVGVDGNQAAIEFARQQFQAPNLRFVKCLADELYLPDGYFDVACCMELLEHLHWDQGRSLLRRLYRLVKPGGRMLITTPNYHSLWPLLEWLLDRSGRVPRLAEEQHVSFYTHRRLAESCQSVGWSTVCQHTCCTLAPWLAPVSWPLAQATRWLEPRMPLGTILVCLLRKPLAESPSKVACWHMALAES